MIGERQSKGGGRMARRPKGEKRWLCRLAARYGWLEDPKPAPGGRPGHRDVGGSDGAHGPTAFLARWARRHIRRCAHCRAEEAEWERIVVWLREADRPAAPAGLLDRVMAGIALERAAQAPGAQSVESETQPESARALKAPALKPALKRMWWRDGSLKDGLAGLVWYVATAMGSLSGAALMLPQGLGLVHRMVASLEVAATSWQAAHLELLSMWERAAFALPEGLQPYVASLWWSAFGVLLAAAIVRVAQQIQLVTSE